MSFQTYLDNIEAKTGKTPAELIAEEMEMRLTEYKDSNAWLKEDSGLGLGYARAVAGLLRHGD